MLCQCSKLSATFLETGSLELSTLSLHQMGMTYWGFQTLVSASSICKGTVPWWVYIGWQKGQGGNWYDDISIVPILRIEKDV